MKSQWKDKARQLWLFYRSIVYLGVLAVAAFILLFYNTFLGVAVFLIALIFVALELIRAEDNKKMLIQFFKDAGIKDNLQSKNIYENFPIPYIVLNSEGIVENYDSKMQKIFFDIDLNGKNIINVLPEVKLDMDYVELEINEEYYKVYLRKIKECSQTEEIFKYVIYFWNNTEYMELNALIKKEKTIITLVFIDNYEEVLEGIEEIRRPLLPAVIDRKLTARAQEIGGVIKRFEKDKYMLMMSYDQFEKMQEKKFDLLDQIKEINMGNQIPVTLSIGVGISENSLAESMEFARIAIDLALGRGGDQAVVKNHDKYNFYGGNTKEVEKNAKVRARVKAFALKELIQEAEDVIIMGHKNPDVDSLGSAIGVVKACQALGRTAHIVINDITTNVRELYNRLIAVDEYKEGIFISSQEAEKFITDKSLLVMVDVHRSSFVECPQLLEMTKKIVVFDHHRRSTEAVENPVLSYIEPYASSTSELITEILQYINEKIKFKAVEADALLGGITVDTKNFAVKTGARTFEAAAFLKRSGADSVRVRTLFQNDMESYRARVTMVKEAEIYKNMAISICKDDVENPALISAQAADELLTITGIKASFVLSKHNDVVSVSARSLGDVNVQVIMEKLGGGGHQTVAGVQLKDREIDDVIQQVKEVIAQYFKEE